MNASTDWGSALAILAAGLILGSLVFFVARRRKASATNKRAEMEARRDALVQQLRDLGDDVAGEERAWLERETAEVLRALDRLPSAATTEPAAPPPRRTSATAGFVYGVVCTLLAGGIVYYLSTFATDRTAPADVEQRIAAAKDAFSRNDLGAVFELTKGVDEPRALTYNAVARMARGELDQARTQLEQATQRDPKLLDAWVALASVRTQSGDKAGANAAIESAIKQHPEEEKQLRGVFAEIQKPPTQLPPDHPPMPGRGTAMPPVATSGAASPSQPIQLTLALDPSSKVTSGIIYVIARGGEAGHPVAVKRIETNAFPLTVNFGGDDTMMGATLPEKIRLEARLDSDGDAGTNDPADPRASADGVSAGSAVTLTLARAN